MLAIVFEFVGGPNDGRTFHGALGDGSDAERYYLVTNHGAIGYRFKVASDFAVETLAEEQLKQTAPHHFQRHYYVVTDRIDEANEVLVRAEYLEGQTGNPAQGVPAAQRKAVAEPHDELLQRYLTRTAQSMAESYSHLWPDADVMSRSLERTLSLHLSRVLMEERFAVFTEAPHPDSSTSPVDLLGIAPSQDWFLACQWLRFDSQETVENARREYVEALARLHRFWLSQRLVIPACRKDLARLANHCEHGFAVLGGIHWTTESAEDATLPIGCQVEVDERSELAQSESVSPVPSLSRPVSIRLRSFPGQGTAFLVYRWLALPRPASSRSS